MDNKGCWIFRALSSLESMRIPHYVSGRVWKKSQKKIRRERRQRMAYKKGGGKW